MIHIDPNHTDLTQPIPVDLTKIGSIHDSDNIWAVNKILASPVHYPVHASRRFTYGSASDPPSPPYDSSAESVTPRGNPKPFHNPPNTVLNIPDNPYSDPSLSYHYLSESSDSSDNEYYKQIPHAKNDKNKCQSKTHFDKPIKKCANITARILTDSYKSNVIWFKFEKDPL